MTISQKSLGTRGTRVRGRWGGEQGRNKDRIKLPDKLENLAKKPKNLKENGNFSSNYLNYLIVFSLNYLNYLNYLYLITPLLTVENWH